MLHNIDISELKLNDTISFKLDSNWLLFNKNKIYTGNITYVDTEYITVLVNNNEIILNINSVANHIFKSKIKIHKEKIPNIYILIGPPACGKSTLKNKMLETNTGLICVEYDALVFTLRNQDTQNDTVKIFAREMGNIAISKALENKYDVVISNTNCFISEITKKINMFNHLANIHFIDVAKGLTIDELLYRNKNRPRQVKESVIIQFWEEYLKLKTYFDFTMLPKKEIYEDYCI